MAPATKRRKIDQPEEITFDPSARQEYLSGYRRRKQARIQHAREVAVKKDKEEKLKERQQLREQRKEDLESHVQAVNAELKKQNDLLNGTSDTEGKGKEEEEDDGDGAEFEGFADKPKPDLPDDDEFVDEDKYTTVTVEAMEESDNAASGEEEQVVKKQTSEEPAFEKAKMKQKRVWTKEKPVGADGKPMQKKRKIKFRYETKSQRAVASKKQKSKNAKAATARRSRT